MRSITLLICLLAAISGVRAQDPAWSQNVSPLAKPTGHVNDEAGVIDAATKQAIETKLRAFKEKSGVEIAVAVVRTTGDRDIFDYSIAVSRGWGIGAKTDDNPGALMLVAVDDRKYFTQVSRNLEDELPDGVVGSLQRQFLVPEFRKQNYGKGISDTIDAYIAEIEQKTSGFAPPPATTGEEKDSPSWFSVFCCLAVILFIVLLVWSNRNSGGKSGGNDGGGGIMDVLPWIILSGVTSGSSSSSGSSWGSSDWGSSGGGSDWGGFGGGGDFGGGGAGGDW